MRLSSVFFVVSVLLLASCARQVPQQSLESLATWSNLGGKISGVAYEITSSLAFNASGDPIVVTFSRPWNSWQVRVRQWDDGRWRALGGILNVSPNRDAQNPTIAVDKLGRPVVTWWERSSRLQGYSNIYVRRWDGEAWVLLGGILDVATSDALFPSVAIDSQNRLVVTWQELEPGSFTNWNLYVKRWENDAGWVQLGEALDLKLDRGVFMPSIAIDSSDKIIVAWGENANIYVKRWNGSSWVRLGSVIDDVVRGASYPSLAISSTGKLYIAWDEANVNSSGDLISRHIYVKRWDGNNTWTSLGGAVSAGVGGQVPSLAVGDGDTLMVSWTSWASGSLPPPTNVHVKRWNGVDRWLAVGSQPVVVKGGNADLGISPAGVPFLAYNYFGEPTDPSDDGAYVKSYQ